MGKQRLLFLDVIRIFSIALIVVAHFGSYWNIPWINFPILFFGVSTGFGIMGVDLLIFVSGAALAISHPTEKVFKDLKGFYGGRLLRIYPAFWVSMAIPIIITPVVLNQIDWYNIIPVLSGFTAFTGAWGGPLNGVYWFIGLIICLYIFYPFISKFIDWNPIAAMIILILISVTSALLLLHFNFMGAAINAQQTTRWFPLCSLAFFGAGIYCIRTGLYPQKTTNRAIILYLANLSFFVFLYHRPILPIADVNLLASIVILAGICVVAMHIDGHIRAAILDAYKKNQALIPKIFRTHS